MILLLQLLFTLQLLDCFGYLTIYNATIYLFNINISTFMLAIIGFVTH